MTFHITPVLSPSTPLETSQPVSFGEQLHACIKISASTFYSLSGLFLSGEVLENKIILNSVYSFDTAQTLKISFGLLISALVSCTKR